jgi:hypothetical protein
MIRYLQIPQISQIQFGYLVGLHVCKYTKIFENISKCMEISVCILFKYSGHLACSSLVIALSFGTQGPGFEPGLFHKACYMVVE